MRNPMRKRESHQGTRRKLLSVVGVLYLLLVSLSAFPKNIRVESVSFNYGEYRCRRSTAVPLWDNEAGEMVTVPEWRASDPAVRPAACVFNDRFTVLVQFISDKKIDWLRIWAEGDFGGLGSPQRPVTVRFKKVNGDIPCWVGEGVFRINTPPSAVDRVTATWDWKYRGPKDDGSAERDVGRTTHPVYLLFARPAPPMEIPWVEVLDYACVWARGRDDLLAAATDIRNGLNEIGDLDGDIDYDPGSYYLEFWKTNDDSGYILLLSQFLSDLRTIPDVLINCFDCTYLLTTFYSAIGVEAANRMVIPTVSGIDDIGCREFVTNYIDPLGDASSWTTTQWVFHCVVSMREAVVRNLIFDSCLDLDGDGDPTAQPCEPLIPAGIYWLDYKETLVAGEPVAEQDTGSTHPCQNARSFIIPGCRVQ